MAAAAGIDVPRTQLLGKTKRSPGYFAIERFDRNGTQRIHTHTIGGLLQVRTATRHWTMATCCGSRAT